MKERLVTLIVVSILIITLICLRIFNNIQMFQESRKSGRKNRRGKKGRSTNLMSDATQLHDGAKKVQSISVICLVRDNEEWLQYFCKQFVLVEQKYDVRFEYYFFENDSTDRSKEVIQNFLKGKKGALHTETYKDKANTGGIQFDRINKLANLRNQLMRLITPLQTDWSLLLDSNIHFEVETFGQMFACQPKINNIGMVTPYTYDRSLGDTRHYYDTYPFVDESGRNFWPRCNFERCHICRANDLPKIPENRHIVDVRSAFGGFAIVETAILNDDMVRWSTIDWAGKHALCEHIAFCEAIRIRFNKRVVIDQRVDTVTWVYEKNKIIDFYFPFFT